MVTRQCYEYRVESIPSGAGWRGTLNNYGSEGWELTGVITHPYDAGVTFFLKRIKIKGKEYTP